MDLFELTQVADIPQAVDAATPKAAQPAADVRFIAGGTTLGYYLNVPPGRPVFQSLTQHFVLGYFQLALSSSVPPSLGYGVAFVSRARRSSKREGGLRTMADKPGQVGRCTPTRLRKN